MNTINYTLHKVIFKFYLSAENSNERVMTRVLLSHGRAKNSSHLNLAGHERSENKTLYKQLLITFFFRCRKHPSYE